MADTTNRNDGHLDLSLKRTIDAPRAYLRSRRAFHTIMRSPEGPDFPCDGSITLEPEFHRMISMPARGSRGRGAGRRRSFVSIVPARPTTATL
jgi:hypothetical protein